MAKKQEMSCGGGVGGGRAVESEGRRSKLQEALVFSVTEESNQSRTFLSGWGKQFIHLFIHICKLSYGHSTNIDGAPFSLPGPVPLAWECSGEYKWI